MSRKVHYFCLYIKSRTMDTMPLSVWIIFVSGGHEDGSKCCFSELPAGFQCGNKKKKCSWQATQELRRCHVVQPIVCSWENQRLPYSSWKGIDKGQRCFTLLGTGLNSSLYPLCSRSSLPQLYCIIRMASSRSAALCWLLWLYPATIVSEFCILFHGEHRDRCRASFLPKVSRNCWYLLQKDLFMRNFEMEDKWEEKHRP